MLIASFNLNNIGRVIEVFLQLSSANTSAERLGSHLQCTICCRPILFEEASSGAYSRAWAFCRAEQDFCFSIQLIHWLLEKGSCGSFDWHPPSSDQPLRLLPYSIRRKRHPWRLPELDVHHHLKALEEAVVGYRIWEAVEELEEELDHLLVPLELVRLLMIEPL